MSALQRWRDVSDPHGGARGEVREEEEEEGGVRAMEVNREALARAGVKTRRDPEDEGDAMRRLVLAFASVALIAAVLTLTSAALVCVASLATRALGRMFRGELIRSRRGRRSTRPSPCCWSTRRLAREAAR